MASIPPIVQSVILCDGIAREGDATTARVNLRGLTHAIRARPGESFPITHPELCVYVVLSGGVGIGRVEVAVVDADTDQFVFGSPPHDFPHSTDRHTVSAIAFRLLRCVFPRPGLYWVEFRHDGRTLRQMPLILR